MDNGRKKLITSEKRLRLYNMPYQLSAVHGRGHVHDRNPNRTPILTQVTVSQGLLEPACVVWSLVNDCQSAWVPFSMKSGTSLTESRVLSSSLYTLHLFRHW